LDNYYAKQGSLFCVCQLFFLAYPVHNIIKTQVGAEDTDNPQTMNLDSINSDDIHFTISEGSGGKFFLFVPINGSVAKRVGATSLGYQGCVQEKSTMTYGYVHDFNTGDYICLITDSGKVSEIKVVRLDSLENLVEISYTTWK
jgi:hypothetical protein